MWPVYMDMYFHSLYAGFDLIAKNQKADKNMAENYRGQKVHKAIKYGRKGKLIKRSIFTIQNKFI